MYIQPISSFHIGFYGKCLYRSGFLLIMMLNRRAKLDKECEHMKLRAGQVILLIAMVVGLFAWGNFHHKNMDSLPSLEQIAKMEDEAELNGYITNFTKPELTAAWGEPAESSSMEDVWYINENTKLIVNYHNNDDHAVVCGIVRH